MLVAGISTKQNGIVADKQGGAYKDASANGGLYGYVARQIKSLRGDKLL